MTNNNFYGVMVALVTPLLADGNIDHPALARLSHRTCSAGVKALCPVGSTGEGPHLTEARRIEIVKRVVAEAPSSVPLIPAVTCTVLEDARRRLGAYARAGATAALVAPPFYYPLGKQAVEDFFVALADDSPLPILLYHIPQFTKSPLTLESVIALARHPRIAGIKDSSRDFEFFQGVAGAGLAGFAVLTGTDTMLMSSLLAGGHGTIAASANLAPEWGVALWEAVRAGELTKARDLQMRILRLVTACRKGSFPAGWKAALEIAGICSGATAAPTPPLSPEGVRELRAELVQLGIVSAAASPAAH